MKINLANSFLKRLKGLMFIREEPELPLLLVPSSRIHTCFMRFTIDVLYLDKSNIIIEKERLKPWRLGMSIKGVEKVLEGRVGLAEEFEIGDKLYFR